MNLFAIKKKKLYLVVYHIAKFNKRTQVIWFNFFMVMGIVYYTVPITKSTHISAFESHDFSSKNKLCVQCVQQSLWTNNFPIFKVE